jgi:hypothetical protein
MPVVCAFPGTGKSHLFRLFNEERVFGCSFSGHGSVYKPEVPEFNKTWEEARKEAIDWESNSDTIGGRSLINCKVNGKVFYVNHDRVNKVYDSDSSGYSKSLDFPTNYVKHILEVSEDPKNIVFVSSHEVVRQALYEARVKAILAYPRPGGDYGLRSEYLRRYKERGSPESFIQLVESNWDLWLNGLENDQRFRGRLVLLSGQYLSDVLPV